MKMFINVFGQWINPRLILHLWKDYSDCCADGAKDMGVVSWRGRTPDEVAEEINRLMAEAASE